MPDGRRLVLHMGMGKTGTTALQVGFVRNRARLRELGVDYPEHGSDADAAQGRVVSGNGLALRRWLTDRESDPESTAITLDGLIEQVSMSACATVLYSSEFLILYQRERLRQLREELLAIGVRLQAVIHVRDVAGHVVSSYSQVVKRGLFTGDLTAYVNDQSVIGYRPHLNRLFPLSRILGPENVEVVHYDGVRDRLFTDFLDRILRLADTSGLDLTPGEINRSLTAAEIQLMRRVNAGLTNQAQAKRVSDLLIQRPHSGETGPVITTAELALLHEKFEDLVAKVRREFLPEAPYGVPSRGVKVVDSLPSEQEWSDREEASLNLVVGLATRR
ncbi:hypothetical protein GCM10027020_16110 [Nocardioides salsibiostraticola]